LTPHKWDVHAAWGPAKRGWTENLDIVAVFKCADNAQLALVGPVGADRPMVSHVNETHALQGKELTIADVDKFAV
jgi:hypothetical protein